MVTSPIEQPVSSASPAEREHYLGLLLQAVLDATSDGVAVLDSQCRVTYVNDAFRQLFGDSRAIALGHPCFETLHLMSADGTPLCGPEGCPGRSLAEGQRLRSPGRLRARDGRVRDVFFTFTRVGPSGPVVVIVHDLTDGQQADHLRSTFVSVISHELQTPIAIIKGYASTLRREDAAWDEQTQRRGLEAIEEEADRLNDMVRNLLSISRIEAGALRLEFTPVQIRSLIVRLVRKMQVRTGEQRRIVTHVAGPLPLVMADKDRIEEVLRNLIENALKYSPPDSTVTVEAWATGTEVVVAVTDRGAGIATEDRERVFEPFQRLETGLTRRRPGAGLGLFICRAIVNAHGGRIWIEHGPGGGTRVLLGLLREQQAQLPVVTFVPLGQPARVAESAAGG